MRFLAILGLVLLGAISTKPALSHSGTLDFRGCHYDFAGGGYHCHKGANAGKRYGSPLELPGQTRPPTKVLKSPLEGAMKPSGAKCCAVCEMSRSRKACGNACISVNKTCDRPRGCSCDSR